MKKNIILLDCALEEAYEYKEQLEMQTKLSWVLKSCISNEIRKTKWDNIKRYLTYFTFPWSVFLHRKEYIS